MYDGGKIFLGFIIFVALVTSPFYIKKAVSKPEPSINTPVINQLEEKRCVESKEFMRTEHMKLLNDWKYSVVRGGTGIYLATDGKQYDMSLQNTCMRCHSNKKQFCDECHNYVAIKPYCWDCHIAPMESRL